MATLLATNGEMAVSRIDLQPGINTIGRAEGNHHVIPHGSVSSRHCEITLHDGTISIRDLGSTNGTFVNGEAIEQTTLAHGQQVRLGNLDFLFESPAHAPAPKAGPLRVNVARASAPVVAEPAPVGQAAAEAIAAISPTFYEEPSYYRQIPTVFGYPFNKSGIIMLVVGSVLFTVLDFLSAFSFYIGMIGMAYLFAYMQKVISHSAQGDDEIPPWPELSDFWNDILLPCLLFIGCFVVSLGPGLALIFFGREDPAMVIGGFVLLGLGALYFPMALLAAAVTDNFLSLSPHVILPSIFRVFLPYVVTVLVLGMLASAGFGAQWFAEQMAGNDFALKAAVLLPLGFLSLYLLTVEMRLLGLMFRAYRHRLGWL
jgi:hypothetical protein